MPFTYKPLWKKLIDKKKKKKALMNSTKISKSTFDKMGQGKFVSMEIIDRLCSYFHCDVSCIISHFCSEESTKNVRKN